MHRLAEIINLLLTAVIAGATVVYAIYAYRLWRETRASVDAALFAQIINWLALAAQQAKPEEQPLVLEFGKIIMEAVVPILVKRYKPFENQDIKVVQTRVEDLCRHIGLDPNQIPGWQVLFGPKSGS